MKKVFLTLMCLTAMMAASTSLKAQEVTITLNPGWTWISYLGTEPQEFATALGSFTPAVGDIIKSQTGTANYMSNGQWRGSLSQFYPGYGYMYKSTRTYPVTLTLSAQQPAPNNAPTGAINGLFTINANGEQVYFSKGNLQYIGSASTPYWKFADNQWDVLGVSGQNTEASDVDRDLFAWGTSGYDHGAICYQPWSMSTNTAHYYVYGNSAYNLYDQTGKADWGYNIISNGGNQENLWRTLMQTEWDYVMYRRSNAANLRYWAQVNGVNGIILLPDNWDNTIYTFVNGGGFIGNVINAENWSNIIEINGAVFLPVNDSNNYGHFSGHYWSSKNYAAYYALQLDFGINYDGSEVEEIWIETNNESLQPRNIRHSVRLVYKVD